MDDNFQSKKVKHFGLRFCDFAIGASTALVADTPTINGIPPPIHIAIPTPAPAQPLGHTSGDRGPSCCCDLQCPQANRASHASCVIGAARVNTHLCAPVFLRHCTRPGLPTTCNVKRRLINEFPRDGQTDNCLEGCAFDNENCPTVVQDGCKVLPQKGHPRQLLMNKQIHDVPAFSACSVEGTLRRLC